jgi:protein tyrosine/serine phosphatase
MKLNNCIIKIAILAITALLLSATALWAEKKEALCSNDLGSPIVKFCEVKPDVLWRGSKPDKDGAAWLINKGVKTIINLELLYDDLDAVNQAEVVQTGSYKVDYFRVKTWEPLYAVAQTIADEDVIHFLAIARQAKKPMYVHCRAGENRTGVMVAAFKIIIDGKTTDVQVAAVLDEMNSYKGVWNEYTTKYIKSLSLRRNEIMERVKAYPLENPTEISCNNGKCVSNSEQSGAVQQ